MLFGIGRSGLNRAGENQEMNVTVTGADSIVIRSCNSLDELTACVDLEIEVWGYSDGDVIPRRSFIVTQEIGGQVFGAFDISLHGSTPNGDAGNLIGFAMSMPGIRNSNGYLHSHMLAVRERYRNLGIGQRLKLVQREDALARNIALMEWTFDPLEIKNAHLNIRRLGVIVRRYTADFYGGSSSRLQAGLPTDRLHAEWWMNSSRVKGVLSGNLPVTDIVSTIEIPAEIAVWKNSTDLTQALAVQSKTKEAFQNAFARGLAVVGFVRDIQGNGVFQLGIAGEGSFS
jgi:predicted GNAT superfamily acetyltransferase